MLWGHRMAESPDITKSPAGKTAAERISEDVLQQRLRGALQVQIHRLHFAISKAAEYPSRPAFDRRLAAVERAAQLLTQETADLDLRAIMLDGDPEIECEHEMHAALRYVIGRVQRVRERAPARQGRGKLSPPLSSGPNLREHCALIVGIFFELTSGRWPGKANAGAQQLCETVWKAAGGPPRPDWGQAGSLASWHRHISAARQYREHAAGILIRRSFAEGVQEKARLRRFSRTLSDAGNM